MGFWLTEIIKEVITPTQPAFDVLKYVDAQIKYGDKTADRMRKAGCFNLTEEEKNNKK